MRFKQKLKYWTSVFIFALGIALLASSIVFSTTGPPPSYHQGYARSVSKSAYPSLWKGLVGAWVPALGVTGVTLRDVSGFGQHGTLTSMDPGADWIIGGNPRLAGYGLRFDHSTGHVAITALTEVVDLPATHNFTVVFWFKAATVATNLVGFSWSGTDDLNFYPNDNAVGSGGTRVFWRDLGSNIISEDGPDLTGDWHRFVFVSRASDDHEAYRDGVSVGTSSATGAAGPFTSIRIGNFGTSQGFDGLLDDVRVYNRAWTNSEILLDYQIPLAPFILRPQLFVRAPVAAGVTPVLRMLMGVGQ